MTWFLIISANKKMKNDPINKSADQGSEEEGLPTRTKIESIDIPSEKTLELYWKAIEKQRAMATKMKKFTQVLTPRGHKQ